MRRLIVVAVALAALAALAIGGASAQEEQQPDGDGPVQTNNVQTIGSVDFIPNGIIFSTQAFYPGEIEVAQGQTVTFAFGRLDLGQEPHTVTVIDEDDLPTTAQEIFTCEPCGEALMAHFPEGEPSPEQMEPGQAVVEAGEDGLDAPGDSLWLGPGDTVEAEITASAGTTLNYVCAIHPWMQGSITVTD